LSAGPSILPAKVRLKRLTAIVAGLSSHSDTDQGRAKRA
jgi:hypothetical protein